MEMRLAEARERAICEEKGCLKVCIALVWN
jgi:hypothetical protein